MLEWLLSEIEKATIAEEKAWDNYISADEGSEEEARANDDVSYLYGKVSAYKEVLKYIEDAQRASVGE